MERSACFKQAAMGWRTGVEFPTQPVPLDPYFLGVWLGDGDACHPNVTTMDEEVAAYLEEIAARPWGACPQRREEGPCSEILSFGGAVWRRT